MVEGMTALRRDEDWQGDNVFVECVEGEKDGVRKME